MGIPLLSSIYIYILNYLKIIYAMPFRYNNLSKVMKDTSM